MRHKITYNKETDKIWFSSDFHFNHKSIVRGESKWVNGVRDFETLEEHNNQLLENINSVVGENDTLYFLGDFCFGSFNYESDFYISKTMVEFRNKIKCKNIHFIVGNHDEPIYNEWFYNNIKVSDSFSSVHRILDLNITITEKNKKNRKEIITLSHYPMRTWDRIYDGAIQLYGHCHNTLDTEKPELSESAWIGNNYYVKSMKTMDVGVDAHNEFRPFELMEILEFMDKKEVTLNNLKLF